MEFRRLIALLQDIGILGRNSIYQSVLWYGSRSGYDVDLAIVMDNIPAQGSAKLGKLDVVFFSLSEFERLIGLLDPVATEPLITGTCLQDDLNIKNLLPLTFKDDDHRTKVVAYLENRHLEEYVRVQGFYDQITSMGQQLPEWWFVNLSYVITYHAYAEWYWRPNSSVISMKHLIAILHPDVSRLLADIFSLKRAQVRRDITRARELLRKMSELLYRPLIDSRCTQ